MANILYLEPYLFIFEHFNGILKGHKNSIKLMTKQLYCHDINTH